MISIKSSSGLLRFKWWIRWSEVDGFLWTLLDSSTWYVPSRSLNPTLTAEFRDSKNHHTHTDISRNQSETVLYSTWFSSHHFILKSWNTQTLSIFTFLELITILISVSTLYEHSYVEVITISIQSWIIASIILVCMHICTPVLTVCQTNPSLNLTQSQL